LIVVRFGAYDKVNVWRLAVRSVSAVQYSTDNSAQDEDTSIIARVFWEDGNQDVLVMEFLPFDHHDLKDAKKVVAAHHELAAGRKTGVLADITRTTKGANGEARSFYVSEEASVMKKGMAMLVKSPLQKMVCNVFFRMSKPPYPSKLFTCRVKAIAWLRSL
jgi:hypothetical protein